MTTTMLPAEFSELEKFSDWVIETEPERYDKRLSSSMAQMQEFYDAAFPRLQEAMAFIDQHDITNLPPEVRNLELLYFALVNVSFPVEVWSQPRVPDSGAATFPCVDEFPY
ncbi:MAG TPA: hypothetical protein VNS81_06045 [Nocardioides sp.]|nr:hypothetical protein [Nocardioides sp.]